MFDYFISKTSKTVLSGYDHNPSERVYQRRVQLRANLKVFISHRWDYDQELHTRLSRFSAFEAGINVNDMSITSDRPVVGPRGGIASNSKVFDRIVERMDECHLVAAPSKAARTPNKWVKDELFTAVRFLKKPILFVDHKPGQQQRTSMMIDLSEIGGRIYHADYDDRSVIAAINKVIADIVDSEMLDDKPN